MEEYNVTVATGTSEYSGTNNYIYITLVGEKGDSERTTLDNPGLDFCRGAVDEYKVCSPGPLGRVLLVRLEKQRYWVEDNWFCLYVTVAPPGGGTALTFPCYRWLIGDVKVELREGTAMRLSDDTSPQLLAHRKAELQERQAVYRWVAWAPGIPKCIDAKTEADLHQDVRFDNEKRSDFESSLHYKLAIRFGKSWDNLEDFKRCFWKLRSPISEYCMEHWKEDSFFGYQCLNGSNPRMIQRCKKLPGNFPVSGDMVQGSLAPRTTLEKELKAGNIYLVDYAIMDGVPTNVIRGKPQYIAAPLCLLYEHPDQGLIPIAIQLGQTPGLDTPIFLPKNPPLAWLLAKIWVRHSEFQVFQLLSHLLRTHLVVEVFCVSTLRQLPAVHPVYKVGGGAVATLPCSWNCILRKCCICLLNPKLLLNVNRAATQIFSATDGPLVEMISYWVILTDVSFLSGLARELHNKTELITLLSVAIFTSSAQHAATNNGQFDWCAWVPNTPCTMRHPPPTDKDAVTMEMIMDTLPDVSQTCLEMAITWHLGRPQPDAIPLGQYREQYFTESQAQEVIDKFRQELKEIEEHILTQNEGLELPYLFLLPSRIENSITI
uniref:Arachidonate 12-lipoxygenase n=1 Tax=Oncorhynchus tshawytscha TaxID=74940 RepID=A0AAZ3QQV4_ONCTS